MAYTTINKSTDYFNTVTYSGTGSARTVTGVGFEPDLFWIKQRSGTQSHLLWDAVRGGNYYLGSNHANASNNDIGTFTSASDGYSFNTDPAYNGNGSTYVGWNWLADNTSGSSNTDGTITSTVSANTTAGFSIVKYTGNGTVNSTIGHGLGTVPDFIIVKCLSSGGTAWGTKNPAYNSPSDPRVLYLNNSNSYDSAQNVWGTSASFTTSTFTVGNWIGSNTNGDDYIAYCWTAKTGYSKFGEYTGNGNADGAFVYTGFKPAFVLIKRSDGTPNWTINDTGRDPTNVNNLRLFPNLNNVESSGSDSMDMLSNGFKLRSTDGGNNFSGGTFIYMAFGQSLVGSNNVPCTAR